MEPAALCADLRPAAAGLAACRGAQWPVRWDDAGMHPPTALSAAWKALGRAFWPRVTVQRVARFLNHPYPCLALAWHPAAPATLLYALASSYIVAADVRSPDRAREVLRLSESRPPLFAHASRDAARPDAFCQASDDDEMRISMLSLRGDMDDPAHRITGLHVSARGAALVATPTALHALPVVTAWTRRTHRLWPARFRDIARLLLLNEAFGGAAAEVVLRDLPPGVLEMVLERAAEPRHAWLPPLPERRLLCSDCACEI